MSPPSAPIAERRIAAIRIEITSYAIGDSDSKRKRRGMLEIKELRKPPNAPHLGLSMKYPQTTPETRGAATKRTT